MVHLWACIAGQKEYALDTSPTQQLSLSPCTSDRTDAEEEDFNSSKLAMLIESINAKAAPQLLDTVFDYNSPLGGSNEPLSGKFDLQFTIYPRNMRRDARWATRAESRVGRAQHKPQPHIPKPVDET